MTSENARRIRDFTREPVPPGGCKDLLVKWRERARSWGTDAPAIFLEMLHEGRYDEQYSSLLSLREYGYEVWLIGSGIDEYYTVRAPGAVEATIIRPVHPDDQGYRAVDGTWIEPDDGHPRYAEGTK